MFHVVALAPWPMRIMEIIPFIRWSFFGLTDSREYLFLFCELLLCWPKSRSHSFLQHHHHHLGCHATESTRLNVEKKMLKISTEWVQNIYEVGLECLPLVAVHNRCRNCFGRFWYPPPPCRNFDPDLPNFYLLLSCNNEICDPPSPLKYSDVNILFP